MKHFLYISYHFAPIGGSGTFRQLHFSRHSPSNGWLPTVLARRPHASLPYDEDLLAEIPAEVAVMRARVAEFTLPQRLLWRLGMDSAASRLTGMYFPDPAIGWYPDAYRQAQKAAQKHKFDAIVSTGFPMTAHLLGMHLAERWGIPWLADYKDEWCDSPYVVFPTPLHRMAAERLESKMLGKADRVLGVTDFFTKRIEKRAGAPKVFTLANGYDERHFAATPPYKRNAKFTLAYIGSYYGMNSPEAVFTALTRLVASGKIPVENLRFLHLGLGDYTVPEAIAEIVERRGFVPQREANAAMQTVELLTQTLPDPAPQSGKVFDYLRAGRPILAMTPKDGMLGQLIRETEGGDVVEPGDVEGITAAILRRYKSWERGENFTSRQDKIAQFEWGRLAASFASHLDAITAPKFQAQS